MPQPIDHVDVNLVTTPRTSKSVVLVSYSLTATNAPPNPTVSILEEWKTANKTARTIRQSLQDGGALGRLDVRTDLAVTLAGGASGASNSSPAAVGSPSPDAPQRTNPQVTFNSLGDVVELTIQAFFNATPLDVDVRQLPRSPLHWDITIGNSSGVFSTGTLEIRTAEDVFALSSLMSRLRVLGGIPDEDDDIGRGA